MSRNRGYWRNTTPSTHLYPWAPVRYRPVRKAFGFAWPRRAVLPTFALAMCWSWAWFPPLVTLVFGPR